MQGHEGAGKIYRGRPCGPRDAPGIALSPGFRGPSWVRPFRTLSCPPPPRGRSTLQPLDSRLITARGGAGISAPPSYSPAPPQRPASALPPPSRKGPKRSRTGRGWARTWTQPMAGRAAYKEANGSQVTAAGGGWAWGGQAARGIPPESGKGPDAAGAAVRGPSQEKGRKETV